MSYSDVIKMCTLWHKVAQYRTKLHKVAQKKWKFSMINVKITNLWDCKTYRWTIFNTRCVLDDSRSNTFLCLSSPPLFLHHFFTLTFVITFTFFLLGEHFQHIIANPGPISSFVTLFNTSLALDDGRSRVFLWRSFRDRGRSSFAAFALDLFFQSPSVKSLNTQF